MKSIGYKTLIDYAKKNNIKFGVINNYEEIDSSFDFNGLSLIDTETLEIPCTFAVDRALIMCIPTPKDMTPDDTGRSQDIYDRMVYDLRTICRPQYIAVDGAYIKLMCWCDWDVPTDTSVYGENLMKEFEACRDKAVATVKANLSNPTYFSVSWLDDEAKPSTDTWAIDNDWFTANHEREFNAEIYTVIDGEGYPTSHGVKYAKYNGMLLMLDY